MSPAPENYRRGIFNPHAHLFLALMKTWQSSFKFLVMKNFFLLAFIIIFLGCDADKKSTDMAGAYSLYRQVINDGTKDSLTDRNQLKIYTDRHMMYASSTGRDSLANYGVGTYEVKDGKIYEYIFFRASEGSIIENRDTAVLQIEPSNTGYMQVIEEIEVAGVKYKFSEQYDKVSKGTTSPLDGAWKQTSSQFISARGDTITNRNPIQFKMFWSGFYIWAQTNKDSANKNVSVFGYGSFEMDGKEKSRETTWNSTFRTALMGRTYEVFFEFDGKDAYKQTIEFRTGDKAIEFYQRLK